jgi:hypothetical protein
MSATNGTVSSEITICPIHHFHEYNYLLTVISTNLAIGQHLQKKSLKIPKGGNQNPYIEEEQTTQWPKEKVQTTINIMSLVAHDN